MATSLSGFWSYVRRDDEADGGRIRQLADDVKTQYEMATGDEIDLFVDRDDIKWGDHWREKIDASLASVAFFVPVLTPRFFMSAECCRELGAFLTRATNLNLAGLVLPILYVDVPALRDKDQKDELIKQVQRMHWEDWTTLRFRGITSDEYRLGVNRLVTHLVDVNRTAEQAPPSSAAELLALVPTESDKSAPGILDQMAGAEDALPKWQETLEDITSEIKLIGEVMAEVAEDFNEAPGKPLSFARKLAIARRLSSELKEPTERVYSFGSQFVSQLREIDEGVQAIIPLAKISVEQDASTKAAVCVFFRAIRSVTVAIGEALDAVEEMTDSMSRLESVSRDLRPTVRRLRQGLTLMQEARSVSSDWVKLIDETGIGCDEAPPASEAKGDAHEE